MGKVEVVQMNLQKSRAATSELVGHILNQNIPLALIQEPYTHKSGNTHRIPGLNGLQCLSRNNSKFLAAILYNRDIIQPLFVPQLSTGNIVVASARIDGTQVFFVSVYLPPNANLLADLPALQRIILETSSYKLVMGGDFNVRSTLWFDHRNDNRAATLEEFIATNNLAVGNQPGTIPTYRSPRGCSFIDLTVTSRNATENITDWAVVEDLVASDHNAIKFQIDTRPGIDAPHVLGPNYVIDCKNLTSEEISEDMEDWSQNFDRQFPHLATTAQVDAAIELLQTGIRSRVMAKGAKRRKYRNRPDWWTDEIERLRKIYMKKKDLFYKNRYREYSDYLHREMTASKVKFSNKLQSTRRKSWERFAETDLNKNPWGVVYRVAAEKFHRAGVLSCFTRDDATITLTPEESMEHLVGTLLPDDLPEENDNLQSQEQSDFNAVVSLPIAADHDEFTLEELSDIVAALDNNKAPGLDTIKGGIVKLAYQWTSEALLRIYNACWRLGYFPRPWKSGNLVILLKDPSGDFGSVRNYRPIVLLPIYGKILEKLIKSRIVQSLTPLHAAPQYGFTTGRSTSDALLHYRNTIRNTTRSYALTIFIDIKGAFDNVWWPGLIRNLRHRNMPQATLALVKSYLTDRDVILKQGDIAAQKRTTKGCPQGSVLGPTLWNFVLDPLLESDWPDGVTIIAYADDIAVVVTDGERQRMVAAAQAALDKITEWARENKLTLSKEKTVVMVNKSPPRAHHRDIRLRIGNTLINRVNTYKYLGVIVDPKLTFESNAAYAANKARRTIMGLRRKASRHWGQETETAIRTIYMGAILPILSYASRVWIDRIHMTKVKRNYLSAYGMIARLVTRSYASVSTDAAGVLAGILPVDLEIEKQNCIRELRQGRGAMFQEELITPGTFDSIRHAAAYVQIKAEDIWQERWNDSSKGRTTYEFRPLVTTDLTQLPKTDFIRTQVLTGHGEFACHLKRIGKREDEECDVCEGEADNPMHRILRCPKFLAAQEAINEELRLWPPSALDIPFMGNDAIFELLCKEPSPDDAGIG
jgi:hypothetical protein